MRERIACIRIELEKLRRIILRGSKSNTNDPKMLAANHDLLKQTFERINRLGVEFPSNCTSLEMLDILEPRLQAWKADEQKMREEEAQRDYMTAPCGHRVHKNCDFQILFFAKIIQKFQQLLSPNSIQNCHDNLSPSCPRTLSLSLYLIT